MTDHVRTYTEMMEHATFLERYRYLQLGGTVGFATFGWDRWINQEFYRSKEWRDVRNEVILRDGGCDLADPDYEIMSGLLIHHINPMTVQDVIQHQHWILNPEYLVTTTHPTHNAIHYGDESLLPHPWEPRRPGDTTLW